ncbi:MAG: hypothetical protein AABW67_02400 [Nanoarchaeota archaeon]
MDYVFEVIDKNRRRMYLTQKRWQHIIKINHDITNCLNEIQETLKNSLKMTDYSIDKDVRY